VRIRRIVCASSASYNVAMRLSSIVLIAVLSSAILAAGTSAAPPGASVPANAPPCHQHGKPAPVPGPVSHRCCQSGHDPAMVRTLQKGPCFASTTRICNFSETLTTTFLNQIRQSALRQSGGPPRLSPLRV